MVGCQDATACNYDVDATDPAACIYTDGICETCSGATDGTGVVVDNDSDDDGVCDADEVVGCQDATACNYMASATDAGTCIFPVDCETCSGETDGTGVIVDNDADDDGICDADEVVGCQDASACNYDSSATDAGTCVFTVSACDTCSGATDGTGTVVDNDADDDGVCDADEVVGCQDASACNYDASATDAGTCIFTVSACDTCSGATDGTGTVVDNDADDDGVCDADEVAGCQDALACNFNALATDPGVDCVYATGCESCSGATDGTGVVVDNDADDDGVCDADEVVGCQDATACNYMAAATDSGECVFTVDACDTCSGETDGTGVVVDNDSDDDGVCDADEIPGCQDALACNYNAAATDEDGSCVHATGCDVCAGTSDDGTGYVSDQDADDDGVCDADEVEGCQDAEACNYNASATDSAACVYATGCETCSGETDGSGVILANDVDGDGICDADEIPGCQDALACNFNASATDDDASCVFPEGCDTCSGATDGTGTVIDNDADGDGVCDADEVVGCQDATACNYDVDATDDGVCYFSSTYFDCFGNCLNDANGNGVCDEIEAMVAGAYSEGVLFGESQCDGEEFCGEGTVWSDAFQMCVEDTSCPGDLNDDGVVGTGDLLMLLMDYGFGCD